MPHSLQAVQDQESLDRIDMNGGRDSVISRPSCERSPCFDGKTSILMTGLGPQRSVVPRALDSLAPQLKECFSIHAHSIGCTICYQNYPVGGFLSYFRIPGELLLMSTV
jgi:hypothetical protein